MMKRHPHDPLDGHAGLADFSEPFSPEGHALLPGLAPSALPHPESSLELSVCVALDLSSICWRGYNDSLDLALFAYRVAHDLVLSSGPRPIHSPEPRTVTVTLHDPAPVPQTPPESRTTPSCSLCRTEASLLPSSLQVLAAAAVAADSSLRTAHLIATTSIPV